MDLSKEPITPKTSKESSFFPPSQFLGMDDEFLIFSIATFSRQIEDWSMIC